MDVNILHWYNINVIFSSYCRRSKLNVLSYTHASRAETVIVNISFNRQTTSCIQVYRSISEFSVFDLGDVTEINI